MQSRSHPNPYPDYLGAQHLYVKEGDVLENDLTEKIDSIVQRMKKELRLTLLDTACTAEYSVYTGYSGLAMLFYRIATLDNDRDSLELSIKALTMAASQVKGKRQGFLTGDSGPLCLLAVIYRLQNENSQAKEYAERLLSLSRAMDYKDIPDEVLYGRSGYLYSLTLANRHLGDHIIPPATIRKVAESIIASGRRLARHKKTAAPLAYEWHDKNYFGAAHGIAGILYNLLLIQDVLTPIELDDLIRPTLDWLLSSVFPSGNFPSSAGSEHDRLVQWCHGAPGFVHLLTLASKVYKEQSYMDMALKCGEVVWARGLVSKGYSLCHGVAGNAYTFLHLYQITGDRKHWHRAACFAHWCTKYPKHEGHRPDRPNSLYEGKAGMVYFLLEVMKPMQSNFPGYALFVR